MAAFDFWGKPPPNHLLRSSQIYIEAATGGVL